jgi:hypothetical protein
VSLESRLEHFDPVIRPRTHALDDPPQFGQRHEHSRHKTTVSTIGATRDVPELRLREEVRDSDLYGFGDFPGYLAKRNRRSTEAFDRYRMRGRARFVRDGNTQAVNLYRHRASDR